VLEYNLGVCKDCHIFLLDLDVEEKGYTKFDLFNQLFDIVLAFYQQYKKQDYKETSVRLVTKEMLVKDNCYFNLCNSFAPYSSLRKQYNLTRRNVEYLYFIALGMSANQIAIYTNRTPRTVEKAISSIRNSFGFDTRYQLDVFLQMFYKSQVKAYLHGKQVDKK